MVTAISSALKDVASDLSSKQVEATQVTLEATDLTAPRGGGMRGTLGRIYGRKTGFRRPNRQRTTEFSYFIQCCPEGSRPTRDLLTWRQAVRDAATAQGKRPQFRVNLEKCINIYLSSQTPQLFTTGPSWDEEFLALHDIKRATWGRVWRWLMDSHLLGWVAHGRQAEFKPKGQQGEGDDGAVYLFCVPVAPEEESAPASPESETDTIPPKGSTVGTTPRAHTYTTDEDNAPHCLKSTSKPRFAALAGRLRGSVPKIFHADITANRAKTKAGRYEVELEFARTVQHLAPALRHENLSTKHLAHVLRKLGVFAKGWAAIDVLNALEVKRDGTRWSHDGATGIKNLAKWIEYRLTPWRDENGYVLDSLRQQARQRQVAVHTERLKTAERVAQEAVVQEVNRAVLAGERPAGEGFKAYLEMKKSLASGRKFA